MVMDRTTYSVSFRAKNNALLFVHEATVAHFSHPERRCFCTRPDLTFPDSNHLPPGRFGRRRIPLVSCLVGGNLLTPPSSVRTLKTVCAMFWTTVPEAPVDEYGHVPPRKDKVGRAAWSHCALESKPKPEPVDSLPESHLGASVTYTPATEVCSPRGSNPLPIRLTATPCHAHIPSMSVPTPHS